MTSREGPQPRQPLTALSTHAVMIKNSHSRDNRPLARIRGLRQVCPTHVLGLVRREYHPRAAAIDIPPDGDRVGIVMRDGPDKFMWWRRIEALLDGSRCECGCELDPDVEPSKLELDLYEPDRQR